MKLNLDKLKSSQIPIGKNGLVADNTRVQIKKKIQPIPLTQEQQQNLKWYGTLNKPQVKQTYLSQGKKKTIEEQKASDKRLAELEEIQNYQKQKVKEAEDLQRSIEIAPYLIPGIGQAMWAGKAVDLATNGISKGKYKSWGNMVDQKTGSGEFIGDLTNPGYYAGAFPKLLSKGFQSTSKYALQKAEPYLLGDKRIPMMSGYKPKQEFWNPFNTKPVIKSKSNIEDLTKAKEFADKFGYNFPSNLERVAKSDKLTDMSIRGLMNRHNTFVRGISINFDIIEKKSPQILQHLADKGIDYRGNPKLAAEYMATHVPIETGYGRASLPGELLRNNKSAIYTSNSIPTAEGYTYGNGYIVKVKKPTNFSSPDRQDWINNNQLDYFENNIPLLNNNGTRNKSVLNKYKPKVADDSKNLLRTERKYIITDKDLEGLNTIDELHDFAKSKIPKYDSYSALDDMDRSKFDELLKSGDTKALRDFRNNHIKEYIKRLSKENNLTPNQKAKVKILDDNSNYLKKDLNEIIASKNENGKYIYGQRELDDEQFNFIKNKYLKTIENNKSEIDNIYELASDDKYAHYLHIGNQGDKLLDVVSSKQITPEIWKSKSRAHTNVYSRGLSMGSYVLPITGLYKLFQPKKQDEVLKHREGGLLYPKVNKLIKRTNQKDIDFVNRLKDPNRKSITNWSNPKEISTHKMSWATDDKGAVIYPNVQNIEGKLIDFTRPPYNKWAGFDSAVQNNDTIQTTPEVAQEYTINYKRFYPNY